MFNIVKCLLDPPEVEHFWRIWHEATTFLMSPHKIAYPMLPLHRGGF